MTLTVSKESILEQWDAAARAYLFPMLDSGYEYPAAVRMSIYRDDSRWLIESLPDDPLFAGSFDWFVRPDARSLGIRGLRIPLDLTETALHRHGLALLDPPDIDPVAVLRSLLPEHRELLLASRAELDARNPHDIPLWMRLEEWFHPDLAQGELPGESETFQMLADAIATGEKQRYSPTRLSNTDWRNWPEGGML